VYCEHEKRALFLGMIYTTALLLCGTGQILASKKGEELSCDYEELKQFMKDSAAKG